MAYVGTGKGLGIEDSKYFYNLSNLNQLFHDSYASRRGGKNNEYDFTVRDPFNPTYNPAKVSSSSKGPPFNRHFEKALEKLLVKKKFVC